MRTTFYPTLVFLCQILVIFKNFQFWSSKWQVLVHSGYYFCRSAACFISAHLLFFTVCMLYAYVVAVICLSQSLCLPVIFRNSLFFYNGLSAKIGVCLTGNLQKYIAKL